MTHVDRPGTLTVLKWMQFGLSTVVALFVAIQFPAASFFLLVGPALLYSVWTMRAVKDKRWSKRFAFTMSLLVTLLTTYVATISPGETSPPQIENLVTIDPSTGAPIPFTALPSSTQELIRQRLTHQFQPTGTRTVGYFALLIWVWCVIGLSLLHWRWLVSN